MRSLPAPRAGLLGLDAREQLVRDRAASLDAISQLTQSIIAHGAGAIEREIQLEHVDARLAEHAERAAFGGARARAPGPRPRSTPRARATRATWYSAAAGEMCGSSPLPDAVTRSTGTGARVAGIGRAQRRDRGRVPPSSSAGLIGPWFEPLDAAPLYGCGPVADGRLQKYFGARERLAEQPRADRAAVALDHAAVRLRSRTRAAPISVTTPG